MKRYHEIGEYLLELGAHPNRLNNWGRTPIYMAVFDNDPTAVEILLR